MIREAFTSLHLCFHEYDVDKNGTMDHSELREAMSRLTGVEMPEDEAIELFNVFMHKRVMQNVVFPGIILFFCGQLTIQDEVRYF